jgi:hypothetical protein
MAGSPHMRDGFVDAEFGMDYYLENLRTGDIAALNPNRTLIGTSDHATIRTEGDGPFLAALIVHYPGGWSIHGLSDEQVLLNGKSLVVTQQITPQSGDLLEVAKDRFRFVPELDSPPEPRLREADPLPSCFAYIRFPDGMDECRVVDHNLLFGRLRMCHVRYPDTKLSRLNALLAPHRGVWYVHALGKGVIARNRRPVSDLAALEDGDELLIGPLVVRIELQAQNAVDSRGIISQFESSQETVTGGSITEAEGPEQAQAVTDAVTIETTLPSIPDIEPAMMAIFAAGARLDHWLKAQAPQTASQPGIGSWFGTQRERLKRFWLDTPETTTARIYRTSGRPEDAFAVLDRALRARPESPDLLRELYRLYESVGLYELCFRPLRQIEKLANARGGTDTWVLETLAKLCEQLGKKRPGMFDRAISYWTKLERATGINYAREKAATMASRTLCESGFSRISGSEM